MLSLVLLLVQFLVILEDLLNCLKQTILGTKVQHSRHGYKNTVDTATTRKQSMTAALQDVCLLAACAFAQTHSDTPLTQ